MFNKSFYSFQFANTQEPLTDDLLHLTHKDSDNKLEYILSHCQEARFIPKFRQVIGKGEVTSTATSPSLPTTTGS